MKILIAILLVLLVSCGNNNNQVAEIKKQMADSSLKWNKQNDSADVIAAAAEKRYDSLMIVLKKGVDSLMYENDSLKANYWVAKYALSRLKTRIKIFRGNPSQLMFSKTWYNRIVEPVDKKLIMP